MQKYKSASMSILTCLPASVTGLLLAMGWIGTAVLPVHAQFQSSTLKNTSSSVTFNPPRGGAPEQTRGGASRGEVACSQDASSHQGQQFIALIPASSYGLTVSDHPTFLAYIPPTSAQAAFFTLKDGNGEVRYQRTVPISASGGVLRVALPETVPALEVGQSYQWGMALLCAGRLRPDSPFINSWIQRIELDATLAHQLDTASPLEQAALYSNHGIWYDSVATLAELRIQQPQDVELIASWETLLQSVELEDVESAPLLH